ncbi:hypothetical protein PCASD_10479 [Puccinia coronata f. sp. avenae]|uniref:Uncharacterized protein n=1 Tax=Puccinia coronata f. sp. avenae TaxID=200324 RepID=A0A2N5TFJ3_9BASI|nr:hypothetical protein PCASD_10479 [Puccinia coronata f. sp. avenae]
MLLPAVIFHLIIQLELSFKATALPSIRPSLPPFWDDSSQAAVSQFPNSMANALDDRNIDGYLPANKRVAPWSSSLNIGSEQQYHDHGPGKRLKLMPEAGAESWTASRLAPENAGYLQGSSIYPSQMPGLYHGALDQQAEFYPQANVPPLKAIYPTSLLPLPQLYIPVLKLLPNSGPSYDWAETSSQIHSGVSGPSAVGLDEFPKNLQSSSSHHHANLNYFSELKRILEVDSIDNKGGSLSHDTTPELTSDNEFNSMLSYNLSERSFYNQSQESSFLGHFQEAF